MLSPGMTALEEAERSGGNSGEANLGNPATVDQGKVILNVSTRDVGQKNLSLGRGKICIAGWLRAFLASTH